MRRLRLPVELLLRRHGWSPLLAAVLAGAALWLHGVATDELQRRIDIDRAALQAAARPPAPTAEADPSLPEARYAAFRAQLVERAALPQTLRILFADAAKNHVALKQVDYKLTRDASGEYLVYRLNVPLKGSYADVRRFAADILTDVHAAALEEIGFKRDSIGAPATEAKLHFAVFLKEGR